MPIQIADGYLLDPHWFIRFRAVYTKHFRKYSTWYYYFFIISQKSIYFAHFYDIFFFCLHISNNISRDIITLPDFLYSAVCSPLRNYIAHFGTSRGVYHPAPPHTVVMLLPSYYCTCEPPTRRRNMGDGGKVALGFLYYSRLTREV